MKLRLMRIFLALRAILFVVLLPGTVAGYIPFGILRSVKQLRMPDINPSSIASGLLILTGMALLLRCVWDFFSRGKGTLAPIDPPKHLVVSGLYRFTRNPMYNGVLAVIVGEAWLFRSIPMMEYAVFVFLMFHLFVMLYEEPTLESKFGEEYRNYQKAVPRWGFTVRAYP